MVKKGDEDGDVYMATSSQNIITIASRQALLPSAFIRPTETETRGCVHAQRATSVSQAWPGCPYPSDMQHVESSAHLHTQEGNAAQAHTHRGCANAHPSDCEQRSVGCTGTCTLLRSMPNMS